MTKFAMTYPARVCKVRKFAQAPSWLSRVTDSLPSSLQEELSSKYTVGLTFLIRKFTISIA